MALSDLMTRVRRGLDPALHERLLPAPSQWRDWAASVVPPDELARVDRIPIRDMGHGYDPFGMSRDGLALGLLITHHLYHHWFRVRSYGIEHVPAEGPVVLAGNHSGTLPLDGLMVCGDLLRKLPTPRAPRAVVDYFVGLMPWVNTIFTRAGAVGGTRANFHELLAHGEMLLVFPEGTRGVGKPFSERYQLQRWTEGHAEFAIRHQAPVVPFAVIGAEEQMPQLFRIDALHLFGAPYLPVPATLVPLPVRYHIHYGAPIDVVGRFQPSDACDAEAVAELALEVKTAVADLIDAGLMQRKGVFA